jgi:chromosome transmission fidelity protein 18
LSGPPGFGKTTVAHVMARMAGYNIVEINASDDRTGDIVKTKIKSALEMQAIIRDANSSETGERTMTMNQKPNLVIIDEIDGVSSKSGNSDVSWITFFFLLEIDFFFVEFHITVGSIGYG